MKVKEVRKELDAIAKTGFAEDKKWAGKIKSILNNILYGIIIIFHGGRATHRLLPPLQ